MARVEMNPALVAELRRSPAMAAMLKRRVEVAAVEARSIAPVGSDDDPHAGRFRDSIKGDLGEHDGVPVGRLESSDPAAAYIIHGTSDTPPHDTLMQAIERTRLL